MLKVKNRYSDPKFFKISKLVYTSLVETFIKNEANLHTFEFDGYGYYNDITLELILQIQISFIIISGI